MVNIEQKNNTILFMSANPKETDMLNLDIEVREIDNKLRLNDLQDKFDLKSQWAVRVNDIQNHLLRYKPEILHFSGHGSTTGELIFLNGQDQAQSVSIEALEELFSILKDEIKCVVLNACYSESQANAIANHIDCVLGMSREISDYAAIQFASSFYQAIGFGKSVKMAFDLGCSQLNILGLKEKSTPKLISKVHNAEDLFLLNGAISEIKPELPKIKDYPVKGNSFTGQKLLSFAIWLFMIFLIYFICYHHHFNEFIKDKYYLIDSRERIDLVIIKFPILLLAMFIGIIFQKDINSIEKYIYSISASIFIFIAILVISLTGNDVSYIFPAIFSIVIGAIHYAILDKKSKKILKLK